MTKPYQRTAQALTELVERSEPGEVLPSEPKLAEQLGVSRATLREAMSALEDRGMIVRRQGVGTYIPPTVIEAGLEDLVSIENMAARVGLEVEMGESEIQHRPADSEEATLLGANQVTEIRRVILAEGEPVAYLVDTIGEGLIPTSVLDRKFHGSVLDLLLERGKPSWSTQEARSALFRPKTWLPIACGYLPDPCCLVLKPVCSHTRARSSTDPRATSCPAHLNFTSCAELVAA